MDKKPTIAENFSKQLDIDRIKRYVNRSEDVRYYQDICQRLRSFDLKTVPCPICSEVNKERRLVATVFDFEYIQCVQCDHVYIDRLPDWKIYSSIAAEVSIKMSRNLYENKEINEYRIQQIAMPKVDYILKECSNLSKGTWLDIGCGTGEILVGAKRRGWETLGVDNNQSSREFAKKVHGIDIIRSDDLAAISLKGIKIISTFNTIEHVADPYEFLKPFIEQTSNSVAVVIEAPQYHSLSSIAQTTFPLFVNRHLLPCSHFQLFTLRSLNFLLDRLNLEIFNSWWFGQDFHEMIQLFGEAEPLFRNSPLHSFLIQHLNDFQSVVDHNKLSDSILTISRRKFSASQS